jgi:hypothetical protein
MKRRKESPPAQGLDAEVVDALRAPATETTSFKEWLIKMPDVGTDKDFARNRRRPRPMRP